MNIWDTYSQVQFSAYSRPIELVLPFSHRFPERFAEYCEARHTVDQMVFDKENWDGEGAFPISFQTKVNAKVALVQFETGVPAPQVTPNSNGTFSFEWESKQGEAHLEIGRTRYSFYVRPLVGAAYFATGSVNEMNASIGYRVDEALFPKPSSTLTHSSINV